MRIEVDFAALRRTKWHEYAVRFVFGGSVTALAGIIAAKYGPVVGGLFLACPAIFPASATLIDKHERQRKEKLGLNGTDRGREAASIDAAGSAIGSVGLLMFGLLTWKLLLEHSVRTVLTLSTLSWLVTSACLWHLRKRDQKLKSRCFES
jgi:hypothetical protein